MRKNNFQIIILLVIVVLVLAAAKIFLLWDIRHKNQQISLMDYEIQSSGTVEQNTIVMQHMIQAASPNIALVNSSSIASDGDIAFIENLESLARSNGLDIQIDSLLFESSATLASSSMTAFKVKAETKGSWAGTHKFLIEMESLPIKIKINNFSTSVDPEDANRVWQSSFEIKALKYK